MSIFNVFQDKVFLFLISSYVNWFIIQKHQCSFNLMQLHCLSITNIFLLFCFQTRFRTSSPKAWFMEYSTQTCSRGRPVLSLSRQNTTSHVHGQRGIHTLIVYTQTLQEPSHKILTLWLIFFLMYMAQHCALIEHKKKSHNCALKNLRHLSWVIRINSINLPLIIDIFSQKKY